MTARALTLLAALAATAAAALAGAAPAVAQQSPPEVTAPSAIVVDARTGAVVYRRAPDAKRPIASATKLMTALLVLERERLSTVVPAVRYRALPVESKLGLREGERMTVADLLRGLLIASANDAAATLAAKVGGGTAGFVRLMNRRARELGLEDTSFANPIGLDQPGNHSTARDLARLTIRLRAFPFFRQVVDTGQTTLKSGARRRTIVNRNRLVRRLDWIDGVKTGHTQGAGYVLVGSSHRRGIRLVSVVLGTPSEDARETDTVKLLDWAARRYRRYFAVERDQVIARVPIRHRAGAELNLIAARSIRTLALKRPRYEVRTLDVPAEVAGPVRAGERLGTVEAYVGGRRVGRVALVAAVDVPEAGFGRRAKDWFTRPSTLLLIVVVAGGLLAAGSLRRRPRPPSRDRRRPEPGEVGAG